MHYPSCVRRAVATAALTFALAAPALAAVPAGFVERQIVAGLSAPTAMTFAPDGRLFVCQQGGALRVIQNGRLLATPFVTLTVDSSGERGLLGVAFDPDFATNQYVYVYYTVPAPAPAPAHNRVSRFTAQGNVAVGNEVVIMDLENLSLSATNHNGGAIHFGPDGKLYVAVGENANGANSQTLNNRLGKMLRINKDGSIPTDNPFYNAASGDNRAIWALGLRNPFTFAFNGDGSRMFINDVGQNTWEEISDGIAGSNYGWSTTEGYTNNPSFRSPLYAYPHTGPFPSGCAIVGGAFHDPAKVDWPAEFDGDYFFSDFCGGWIYRFDPAAPGTTQQFATGLSFPVDLATGPEGDLYYATQGSGIGRISTDRIFPDGFASGDVSAWSDAATAFGDLTVTSAAGMGDTSLGLEAIVDDLAPLYVRDDTPNDENRYRARFYFDPNGFDPGEARGHLRVRLLIALEDTQPLRRLVTLVLRRQLGVYSLMARIRLDNGTRADTPFVTLTDDAHAIEIDWRRSGTGAPSGGFTLLVDGAAVATLSGLDNDASAVDFVRLGAMTVKGGASGTMYFDEFDSRRESAIGLLP